MKAIMMCGESGGIWNDERMYCILRRGHDGEHEFDVPNLVEDDSYCGCDLDPDEEESASNSCKACGKLLS